MFNVHQRAMPRLKRAQAQKFIAQSDAVSYRAWECLDGKRWKHDVLLSLFECVLLCIFHVICGCGCLHMCMFTLALVLCRRDMIIPLAAALDTVWLSSFSLYQRVWHLFMANGSPWITIITKRFSVSCKQTGNCIYINLPNTHRSQCLIVCNSAVFVKEFQLCHLHMEASTDIHTNVREFVIL